MLDAVLADDRHVLDAHAAEARQVDARLDRDAVARPRACPSTRSRAAAPRAPRGRRRGRARGRSCSPKPAAVIGSRAIASASMPVIPALIPATAFSCASRQTSYASAQLVGQRPAGRERPRAVAAVAVDAHAPVDRDERALLDDRIASGARAAARRSGPRRRSTSNDSSCAPWACSSSCSRQASSSSLRPTQVSAVSASRPRSAIRAARGASRPPPRP